MASPLTSQQTDRVTTEVKINGTKLNDDLHVVSIVVEKNINKLPIATVEILDGSSSDQNHENLDEQNYNVGEPIIINAGYAEQTDQIFKGIIMSVGLSGNSSDHGRLIIEATDECHKMTVNRKTKYFENMKDNAIVQQICGDNGLQVQADSTNTTHKKITQYACTDWDFIMDRAAACTKIIVAEDNKLNFVQPGGGSSPVELEYGLDIIDMDFDFDGSKQLKSVTVKAWDPSQHTLVSGSSSEPSYIEKQGSSDISGNTIAGNLDITPQEIIAPFPMESSELNDLASSILLSSRLSKMRGFIECQGHAGIKINEYLNIKKVHKYFDGEAYVSGVIHKIEEGNFTTKIIFGIDKNQMYQKPEGSAMLDSFGAVPPAKGLFIGTVTKVDSDPDNDFRVQVKIPAFDIDNEGLWARMASTYAGKDYGYVWYPEKDDQVILGFLMNDPRHPIILGSIYSKTHNVHTDFTPANPNHKKAIVTRSKMMMSFDDEKKNIQIKTPGNHIIDIKDEDKTIKITDNRGSFILFNNDGIEINSKKNIKLFAQSDINIEAKMGKLDIKAMGDITGKSSTGKVSLTAMSEFFAKGGTGKLKLSFATTDLDGMMVNVKATALNTIKGSMVMIN